MFTLALGLIGALLNRLQRLRKQKQSLKFRTINRQVFFSVPLDKCITLHVPFLHLSTTPQLQKIKALRNFCGIKTDLHRCEIYMLIELNNSRFSLYFFNNFDLLIKNVNTETWIEKHKKCTNQ